MVSPNIPVTANPAIDAAAIVPSSDEIDPNPRAIYVAVTGDLTVVMAGGSQVTFNGVPAGIFPISVKKVLASSTASGMVGLY